MYKWEMNYTKPVSKAWNSKQNEKIMEMSNIIIELL